MKEKTPRALEFMQKIQRAMTRYRGKVGNSEFKASDFELIPVEVIIPDLDPLFHDYRIVNLSDIHLGQWITPHHLEGIVELVNNQNPDMITITGDFVSYILNEVEKPLERLLKLLNPKDISMAVLGNHDHWLGADRIRNILQNCDITDVSNDVFTLKRASADNNAVLHLAGVDSVMLGKHRLDLVMEKIPSEGPAILLAHEPDFADVSSITGRFDLQISGHSHGGQFVIPGLGTMIRGPHFIKYPLGKYQVGDMIQYTSRGLGTNVFWFRINCPPEITIFHLKSPEVDDEQVRQE
ncbi:MAG: metallophosphoesterase [Methanobacteriaceae archaeon]|nr:metallophosphoesterase [Methanobacteriaceae archaeon]MDP3624813.1 metallophosphoesterase [Methanobacteriaceae archaeon]